MDTDNRAVPEIDLVTFLTETVKPIVEHPDEVKVTEETTDDTVVLTLTVAEGDMGMIIGKHGKIARAIRAVTKAAAKIADKKIAVEIK